MTSFLSGYYPEEADLSEVQESKNWYPFWILVGLVILYFTFRGII